MAFNYKKPSLTWHRIYITLLYIRGSIGMLYGIINYYLSFSKLNSSSYYFTEKKFTILTLSYLVLLCLDLIRIILEFNTAKKLKEFNPTGYKLNNYLHAFVSVSYGIMGIFKGIILEDEKGYNALAGFFLAVIWSLAVWLPIYIYYSKRFKFFSNKNPNNDPQIVLLNTPTDILETCEEHSSDEEVYNDYIESLLASDSITPKQAEVLLTLYCPNEQPEEDDKKADSSLNHTFNVIVYCRKCGVELPSDSTFCNKCGFSITEMDSSKEIACNSCNHLVPQDSEFCPYCGKQPRKHLSNKSINKKRRLATLISIISLSVIILGLGTLNIIQFQKSQDNKAIIALCQKGLKERNEKISKLNNEIESLEEKVKNYDKLNEQVDFYNEYAVIIQDDGTGLYHTYTCSKIDLYTYGFFIYNDKTAIIQGYKACAYCQK